MIRKMVAGALLLLALSAMAQDQATTDDAIATRMMAEVQPVRVGGIVLWAQPDALPADEARAFAEELDAGLAAIVRLTGEQVDRAHFGDPAVHVFVSSRIATSHVYGGYAHPRYNKAYLYLNARRVRTRAAPYLHELTHIVLWQFGSHSLREGFASYVEGRLAGEGVGYNSGVFGPGPREDVDAAAATVLATDSGRSLIEWIGRKGGTDPSITGADNPSSRAAFYLLTRSFVQHMLDVIDIATFIRIYRAEDTDAAYHQHTGRTLDQWRASWLESLGQG